MNKTMDGFTTPPDHINFLAKKLFGQCGEIIDGAVAYLEAGGGGPATEHSHEHAHLFIVVEGEAVVKTDSGEHIIGKNESYLVDGGIVHSVWNNSPDRTIMIGISVKQRK